jgi:hypothetical protein
VGAELVEREAKRTELLIVIDQQVERTVDLYIV